MNQIICDICGCEYAETSEVCPVCGYPRQGTEKTVTAATAVEHVKVKGGRFSNKNVKKRRKAQQKSAESDGKKERSDKPLLIVIALLLIAIVLVSVYIGQRFIWGSGNAFLTNRGQRPAATTAPAVTTAAPSVPCAGILVDTPVIALDVEGQTQKLELTVMPEDTTDELTFASSDEAVVQVSADGTLTAVGSGQAEITITCGAVVRSCSVVCWFGEETTVPPETTVPMETTKPTEPEETEAAVLTLDPNDVSLFSVNESFTIYARLGSSSVSRSKVTWSTSDPRIATVDKGVVTAVGKGVATITAAYEGQKATCAVRCRFENPTNQEDQSGQEGTTEQTWKASHSDVSISVGEAFKLTVKNNDGETADAIWTMSIDGVVSVDGKTITGRAPGTVTLTTTVEGQTFTCIIRVK